MYVSSLLHKQQTTQKSAETLDRLITALMKDTDLQRTMQKTASAPNLVDDLQAIRTSVQDYLDIIESTIGDATVQWPPKNAISKQD